ncbi:DNA repair protein RecN [Croceicoccus sp. F390]|uniref:DNA repair protein RecN n=1 Tax=Croceicoccus esteveae TaxID=3075597 RepID=A0ABU2ZE42_9SPHN|nr:DNA repair protein RecN [Croceicoccus sp. F390]MDT0574867.1 DNA repair protein RecN [Croceicoccus sp. F390]
MLTSLAIRNIVLIEALDLAFGRGLGVLTGETGAGKSILLDALGLVLGNRADSALVRAGANEASVTALFEFASLPAGMAQVLEDGGIEIEEGEPLILRRTIKVDSATGEGAGSKAFVNAQPVGVAVLRAIAPFLVELHGQHDDRGLVNPRGHRILLTRYAEADEAEVARAWRRWRRAQEALLAARQTADTAAAEQDLFLAHLEELNALAPVPGEEEELALARADMQKGERLSGDLDTLRHLWAGSDSALAQLRSAARQLDRIAPEHPLLAQALEALDRCIVEGGEAEEHIARAAEVLSHDPERLDTTERRLFDLRAAARKHDCAVDELAGRMVDLRAALDAIEGGEHRLRELEKDAAEAAEAYRNLAEALSAQRLAAARWLDAAVAAELAPLKLDAARFQTAVTPLEEERWGPHGMDNVEFLIATNPGAPFAPLAKIASGGELSRFILALKVALAEQGGAAVIIFDEIDRGVGGAVASAIGERLARLATGGQLLAVTHSPQVAARGDTHYLIAKSSGKPVLAQKSLPADAMVTRTSVVQLSTEQRQEEIARMLSGAQVTPEARAQAERLLEHG